MTALKYARQIVNEVRAYQKIKASMNKLNTHIHHYNKMKLSTHDHRKKAAISVHLAKLHRKAIVIKKRAKASQHKIYHTMQHMYKSL